MLLFCHGTEVQQETHDDGNDNDGKTTPPVNPPLRSRSSVKKSTAKQNMASANRMVSGINSRPRVLFFLVVTGLSLMILIW